MKFYIISGEASGDLHGSNLIRELKKLDPVAHFRCWGGDLMEQQGATIVKHYRDLAYMGFFEVVLHLYTIAKNITFCKKDLLNYRPDVLILIDYPGFNLRIAEFAHSNGIKVFYYISPQLWAWRSSRVKIIKANVDRMFVILPFEKEFYDEQHYQVDYVGHPLLDIINEDLQYTDRKTFLEKNKLTGMPIIALLPGSRKQEIQNVLEILLSITPAMKNYQFVIAGSPSVDLKFYKQFIGKSDVKVIFDQTYDLLKHSEAAAVTSGTATLETALIGTPQVVCYRANAFSYMIARKLVKVGFISLVNLIMKRELVKELIQDNLTDKRLIYELKATLDDKAIRQRIIYTYQSLKERLGGKGASERTATLIIQYLKDIEVN
ncbi:MAG: lipid-A-disaccharide synthase [Bacteroidetes bacterium]|nr:lipid-A-disaccharide synthase [Bacteroidota bacterium]